MNYLKSTRLLLLSALLGLGYSDTLLAQPVLTVATNPPTSPTSLAFNGIPANSTSQPQNLYVSWNQTSTGTVVVTTQTSPTNWIVVGTSLNINNTPAQLPVSVNTAGLAQGSYSGTIKVTVAGQTAISQMVPVTLTVSSASVLSANPSSLSFTAQQGASTSVPSSATVQISSSGPTLNYSISGSTQSGGPWLLLGSTVGTTGDAGFQVFASPTGLAAGTYNGTINVQSSSSTDSVQIAVTLTVGANGTLSASPQNPQPFLWQTGTPDPAALQLNITSSSGTVNYNVTLNPPATWLVVSPLNGNTPGTVLVFPKPVEAGLNPGNYQTNVVITSTSGGSSVSVPITLIVAAHPLIQLSGNSLTYSAQFGSSTLPADQTVQVTASDGSKQGFNFASDAAWLTASPTGTGFATSGSGSTPATLTIRANPAGLPAGSSTAHILVTPTNGDNYTQTISVTISLTATATLQAGPQALLFSYQSGASLPGSQTVTVQSTGQPLSFTVNPTTTVSSGCPQNWLSATASSTTTPATITVSATNVGAMAPGLCNGAIALNYNSATGATSLIINVTTAVSAATQPELVVSMSSSFGLETAQLGAQAYARSIVLTSTNGAPVDFVAQTATPWLGFLGATSGFTPQNLQVTIIPSVLNAPGTYSGTITLSSTTIPNYILTIPVTLNLTSNINVSVSPSSLTFNESQGGPLPPAQTLTLASTGGTTASFTGSIQYITGSNWLQISPTSGPASGPIQVSIQANSLSQGSYSANILLSLVGASQQTINVPVTLNVGPAQTLTASPSSLNFVYQLTGTTPASQTITVTSTGGPVTFNVGTTATPSGWLNTDIASGTTGGTGLTKNIIVTANPQGLAAGTYNGSVSITAAGVLANPISIPVQLVVTPAPVPIPTTVLNGASFVAGVIAPGEIITIKGTLLGPTTGVNFKLNSSGGVDPILSGVRVLFGGVPGTPIYVSASQINVIVPWEVAGQLSTNMVVEYNGVQSAAIPLAMATGTTQQAPGLFTATQTGSGQLSAINQNGTYNGVAGSGTSPAPQGSVVSLYGTGGPQTNPPSKTGSVTPIPQNASGLLNITGATATIGGVPATVQFAGAAPGLVTGVFQVNVVVPTGITPGPNVPITVSFNGVSTPAGTTIAVQ